MPYQVRQQSDGKWWVVEIPGNYVHDKFSTKEEAENAARRLMIEDKITDAASDLIDEAIGKLQEKFGVDERTARRVLKEQI